MIYALLQIDSLFTLEIAKVVFRWIRNNTLTYFLFQIFYENKRYLETYHKAIK